MNRRDELWARQWLSRTEVRRVLDREINGGPLPPEVVDLLDMWQQQARGQDVIPVDSPPPAEPCPVCGYNPDFHAPDVEDEVHPLTAPWEDDPRNHFDPWEPLWPDPEAQAQAQIAPLGKGTVQPSDADGWMSTADMAKHMRLTQARVRQLADAGLLECQQNRPGAHRKVRLPPKS